MGYFSDEKAVCRGCGRELIGKPHYQGGNAYVPRPDGRIGEQARETFYGGYVCSRECDVRTSLELERTMPGHDWRQQRPGCFAMERINRNWPHE